MKTRLSILIVLALMLTLALPAFAQSNGQGGDEALPASKLTIKSTTRVDMRRNFATLPLHKGTADGTPVWFVITDVSDQAIARQLGVNFAPKLANITVGCPACAQQVVSSSRILGSDTVEFEGMPDFSPSRLLVPSPIGFPPLAFHPGAMGDPHYSPFVHIKGTTHRLVYNASIVAVGDGPFDVVTHTNTHDRVLGIDTTNMTVDLLFVRGFANGKPILYLSHESSDALTAVIERNTFVPALALSPFPNGSTRPDSARAEIFTFANGQDGVSSPPAQGQTHVINDGANALDANLQNTEVLKALTERELGGNEGDAHNVFETFPTLRDPQLRNAYTPLWDLNIGFWNPYAVGLGLNRAQTDANEIRQLAAKGIVTNPGLLPLSSANIVINCPALAFTEDPPRAPQADRPQMPLPQLSVQQIIDNTVDLSQRRQR